VLSLLLITALVASPEQPCVAILPPTTDQADAASLGWAFADALTARLLAHSKFDRGTGQRQYPLSVFGWRESRSALREAGFDAKTLLSARRAERVASFLGADALWVGMFAQKSDSIELIWQLKGVRAGQERKLSIDKERLALGVEQVFRAVIADLGLDDGAVPDHALPVQPYEVERAYGEGLAVLAEQSMDPRAQVLLSPALLESAHAALARATTLSPQFASAWAWQSISSAMLGRTAAADQELARAMQDLGYTPTTTLAVYYSFWRSDRATDALAALQASINTHQGFMLGRGYLGQAMLRANHPHEALTAFTAYLALAPGNPWAVIKHSEALARIGQHEQAISELKTLLGKLGSSPLLQGALVARYTDALRLKDARATAEAGLKQFPFDPELLARLAQIDLEQDNLPAAQQHAESAVANLAKSANHEFAGFAQLMLGHVLARLGRRDEAVGALRMADRLGVDVYERTVLLRDTHLKAFFEDPRCPIRSEGVPLPPEQP